MYPFLCSQVKYRSWSSSLKETNSIKFDKRVFSVFKTRPRVRDCLCRRCRDFRRVTRREWLDCFDLFSCLIKLADDLNLFSIILSFSSGPLRTTFLFQTTQPLETRNTLRIFRCVPTNSKFLIRQFWLWILNQVLSTSNSELFAIGLSTP